jgi:basic membrane protein A
LRRSPLIRLAAVAASAALALAACGSSKSSSSSGTTSSSAGAATSTTAAAKKLKVGLAYDVGGRGDKSFNDAAAAGLDKAETELGLDVKELSATQGETDAEKEARLKLLADGGYNPIIAVGFAYSKATASVAKAYPAIKFGIVDDADAKADNITNLLFAENQSSFLVGAIAALKSKTGQVGFIGGVNVPLLNKFEAGYTAGAKKINPSIKVVSKYISQPPDFTGFNDPAKGTTIANGMYDGGADVVYAAAGGSGSGVFTAAKAKGKLAIGVDSDQYQSADAAVKDVIITSALKKVDTAVYDYIKSVSDGSVKSGEVRFDLKNDGVGYATSGGKIDDVKSQVEALKQQLIAGTITAPSTL